MIIASYNREENIIYITREGEISLQDLLSSINEIDLNFRDFESLYILEELGESSVNYTKEDYPIIVEHISKRISNYKEVRSALVVTTPNHTALSVLYERISNKLKDYSFKTFTTKEATEDWLRNGVYFGKGVN